MALTALAVLLLARVWTRDRDEQRPGPSQACSAGSGECSEARDGLELPEAIRFGVPAPTVSIALFVKFAGHDSVPSRQIFQRLTRALAAGTTGHATELRLLHAPGACEGPARGATSCLAARAVECVERMAPGAGMRAAGVAFDAHWQPERDLLVDMGMLGVEVDALRRCVAADPEVDARLVEHAGAARRLGFVAAPAGFIIFIGSVSSVSSVSSVAVPGARPRVAPFGAWLTETSLWSLTQCLVDGRCQEVP